MGHTLSRYQQNTGFTLIELLVVMVILGITSSLVAPDMFAIVKRSQAKTELAKIKAIAELSIERSFFSSSQMTISFKDNVVVFSVLNSAAEPENKVLKTIESEFFIFAETDIVITKGNWQGSHVVKITKSPANKLTEFVLFDVNDVSQLSAGGSETSEADYNDVINNEEGYRE